MRLVREFIRDSLYKQGQGYFSLTDCVLRPEPIDFTKLVGASAYHKHVNALYRSKTTNAWLTPVEVFKPWYSRAIANYILHNTTQQQLTVVEFGGGNGTNANIILNYLREKSPSVYKSMRYTLVEISPAMAQRQKELLEEAHGEDRFSVLTKDMLQWNEVVHDQCFVLGLEVLDNLPHDKLVRKVSDVTLERWDEFTDANREEWFQTMVGVEETEGAYFEKLMPLTDPLALRTASHFLKPKETADLASPSPGGLFSRLERFFNPCHKMRREKFEQHDTSSDVRSIFVPSGALELMETLFKYFPKHELILADFTHLPPPDLSRKVIRASRGSPGCLVGCKNAPIVSGEDGDYSTYFEQPGTADIFFQTDFDALREVYLSLCKSNHSSKRESKVTSSQEFLRQHGEFHKTRTRTGYNPMLDDYENTAFFLSRIVEPSS